MRGGDFKEMIAVAISIWSLAVGLYSLANSIKELKIVVPNKFELNHSGIKDPTISVVQYPTSVEDDRKNRVAQIVENMAKAPTKEG